jgi:hypothetical protein
VTGSGGNAGVVIIVNTDHNLVTKELQANPPFAGACSFPGRNTISGPNGVIVIEKGRNTDVWAGDGPVLKASSIPTLCVPVNPPNPTSADIDKPSSVKVLDLKTGATKATVYTGGIGRADELCYNPISDVVLVANDETFDNFITFIGEDSFKCRGAFSATVFCSTAARRCRNRWATWSIRSRLQMLTGSAANQVRRLGYECRHRPGD